MSLLLPTWQNTIKKEVVQNLLRGTDPETSKSLTESLLRQDALTRLFTARLHWELSTTVTSNHLLGMVAMSNTLMSMNMATFIPESERRMLARQATKTSAAWASDDDHEEIFT